MKCDRTQKVSLLIDGELPRAEARELESHLDLCGDCRSAREDFLLLRRQIAVYPLELDAFARQRVLERILATGAQGTARENETTVPQTPRRRSTGAGMFGMPRLSPAGLVALSLLLIGVAAGVVSLLNTRRAPAEIASSAPTPASNINHNSSAATSNTPSPAPDELAASANKPGDVEQVAGDGQKRAGAEATKGASGNAARGANEGRADGASAKGAGGAQTGARSGVNARRVESAGGGVSQKRSATPLDFKQPQPATPFAEAARNGAQATGNGAGDAGVGDARPREGDAAGTRRSQGVEGSKTARHVEQAQLLLRSFRNVRPADEGRLASSDLAHEKRRSRKLLYENIVLRREAASRGNLPVESLLDSLEPILLDIANLPDKPAPADLRAINERMRRKNLVAMLQISAVESAAARSY
jgi:hypothetical protein